MGDWMHNNHLGTDLYLHGGIIKDLVKGRSSGLEAATIKGRYDELWELLDDAYGDLPTKSRIQKLSDKSLSTNVI